MRAEGQHPGTSAALPSSQDSTDSSVFTRRRSESTWRRNLLALRSMPSATIQIELSRPATIDRTISARGAALASFSE
jgi:hypothetical protein